MSENSHSKSGMKRGRAARIVLPLALLVLIPSSAAPQVDPQAAWKAALERIGAGDYQGAAPLLDDLRLRDDFPKASEAGFLLGVSRHRQGMWQEAAGLLEASAGHLPPLADYSLYLAASALQGLGRRPQAIDLLSRLLLEHPNSLLAERAERERASLYAEVNLLPEAGRAYRDYLNRASDAAQRREATLALAEILLKEGRRGEAAELLRQLWLKWPGNREAARAGELLSAMPEAPPFTPDEQFDRALALYNGGQYAQAAAAFSPFLDGSTPRASRARLLSGISRFHLRDYHLAISVLSPMTKEASSLRSEALYWIGRSYGRLDERERAIATLTRLIDLYPRSAWADDSLYMVALNHSEDGKPKRAVEALSRLIRRYPSSDLADVALWTRAWVNYRESALTAALHDLERLQKGSPSPSRLRVRAFYWSGRILEQLGKRPEALRAYRALLETFSDEYYYAEQTRRRLDRLTPSGVSVVTAASPKTAVFSAQESPPVPSAPQVTKARLLKELNLRDEASEEFWDLTIRYAEDRGLLYEACSAFLELGRVEKSLWVAKRLLRPLYARTRPAEPVPRYWDFLYPLGYWELVKEQSARHALDPYLVVALIREESAFGERAVSRAGAIGLMQLLPRTVDQIVNAGGVTTESRSLESPATNIKFGTQYLAKMLEEFKGNWILSLAAYNAGPHHVRRWVETRGHRSDDEFIE
ncbi:MAG: transglycosylase SLT domain-containing protein, partial [Candidatus Methylomirabilis oxyfera]|nr:transglycosylase SLT domain-containing protein [Candidatus Methylomirabilis oxyfera]